MTFDKNQQKSSGDLTPSLVLGVMIPNNVKIEDIQAMLESVREYGKF